ncbi:1,3-propanediol dehydrogenase [Evansella caseinilytica]|uniref:1,3-propanediol dehydrogenase n=1 Tax=Evansella caseinilytica TaxID=1503961 RepID=A0A1H3IID0_9BACI|nr:iron-containing alcohol dehydrogenase [Evansella caseinilytica]SDY26604.1 1,3-propanediol dehydrogenase [Evansella caseinilytica]
MNNTINKFVTPEIIFGTGSIKQTGDACLRLGAKKVIIVSDPGVAEAGWLTEVIKACETSGLDYITYSELTTNPKDFEVAQGSEVYLREECDSVIGVGGGSTLDVAKSIAILASNGGNISDYEGVDKISKPLPPMVMAATTAGSGSEVSQFSVIVDTKRKKKMTIISKTLIPDIAIVDPQTLATKSPSLTASTGMDVLTHSIEAYVSAAATPLTDVQAKNALSLVAEYLRPSVASRSNEAAKTAMAMASLQSGLAFSNAILGAAHAISHAIGGKLPMAHGEINSILLPHVMDFNFIAKPQKFKEIAGLMGVDTRTLSVKEAACGAVKLVREIAADIGTPMTLSDIGFQKDYIPDICAAALADACMITNPRDTTYWDIEKLLHDAL